MNQKKHHHYVPIAYLKAFCDLQAKIYVYRKDDPNKLIHQKPENTAFHKYYYSQPLLEGGKDNNALEDLFSNVEGKWPAIVAKIEAGIDINDSLEDIFTFIALQRARVPTIRDAFEKMLAEEVKSTARVMDKSGRLPPKPAGLEGIEVAIDPHQSIHAMPKIIEAMGSIFDRIGIGALHNKTNIPFLTSDNPIIWFDPTVTEAKMKPYVIQPNKPLVMLFPISPRLMIYGHSSMHDGFIREGFGYGNISKSSSVKQMNKQICRFAYEAIFAQSTGQEAIIGKYAELSPVLETQIVPTANGELMIHQFVFGQRITKPKWN